MYFELLDCDRVGQPKYINSALRTVLLQSWSHIMEYFHDFTSSKLVINSKFLCLLVNPTFDLLYFKDFQTFKD